MKSLHLIPLLLVFTLSLQAQTYQYQETKDDDYLPPAEEKSPRKKGYVFSSDSIFTIQVNTDAAGNNIPDDAANETSLAIDPTNPNRMAIGWRQFDNIASNFRQAGLAISSDLGNSWQNQPPIEAGLFRSDPVLATDSQGKFYYNSLSDGFSCEVFTSDDLEDWSDKTYAFGGDKQWMVIDQTDNPSNGNIYANWKAEFSDCDGNFTRSIDAGLSYEDCSFVDNNPIRGTLAIGPEGGLYACGQFGAGHYFLRSESAQDPGSAVVWEEQTAVDLKGSLAQRAGPNPGGMLGQVWVAVDNSVQDTRGNVYVLSPVNRNDNNDPSDMMFSKSTDQGRTWSEAISVAKDNSNSNWQWFGSISVAPSGRIDISWLDTRDNPGTVLSSLYYTFSLDGGETWSEDQRLSEAFDPHLGWPQQQKMGDYFQMISEDEGVHLAWAATFNGEQDAYYSFIPFGQTISSVAHLNPERLTAFELSPNPAKESFSLQLESKVNQKISLRIMNSEAKLIQQDYLSLKEGKLTQLIDTSSWENGVYLVHLESETWSETRRIVVLN